MLVDMKKSAKAKDDKRKVVRAGTGVRTVLDRSAWIAAARDELIAGGIGAVKVGKLAETLGVTRESFYHHFKSLEELQEQLLTDWDEGNVAAYEALLAVGAAGDGESDFRAMEKMWLGEARYSPAWDAAIRDWARVSKKAAQVVKHIDDRRVDMIRRMFLNKGFDAEEALVRARIYYYHQVGYYTIKPGESREERLRLFPVYIRVLMGQS